MESYLKGALSVVIAWWAGIHPTWQALLLFQILDIVTGLIVAGMRGEISSEKSHKGMLKKVLVWILVSAAGLLSWGARHMGLPFDVPASSIAATFYCLTEFISIVENIGRAGVPLPPYVAALLEKVNRATGPQQQPVKHESQSQA